MLCMLQTGSPWKKVNGKWVVEQAQQELPRDRQEKKLREIFNKYNKTKETQVQEWVDTSFIKDYTDHTQMLNILQKVESDYPDIAERYTIGYSEKGRRLDCLR